MSLNAPRRWRAICVSANCCSIFQPVSSRQAIPPVLLPFHARHRSPPSSGSVWATRLLEDFRDVAGKFWLVKPKAASLEQLADDLRRAA